LTVTIRQADTGKLNVGLYDDKYILKRYRKINLLITYSITKTMNSIKKQDSPAYKLLEKGTASMTDSELISVITGKTVEQVRDALAEYRVIDLGKLDYCQLVAVGIPHTASLRLMASLELSRRKEYPEEVQITTSKAAYDIMRPIIGHLDHEEQFVIFLNRANKVKKIWQHTVGGISGTVNDIRLILKKAVDIKSSSIIMAHNHPSGNIKPSQSDIAIIKKLKEACKLLDITLLDSLIICENHYTSFADEGLI
jgi:DNA repair protein RadC